MGSKLSNSSTVINVIVSTLGTGILYMPASFKLLGYLYAFCALALVGFLTYFSLYSLAYAAVITECKEDASYPKVASLFSKYLKIAVDIAMIGSNTGVSICIFRIFCMNAAMMARMPGIDVEVLRRIILCLCVFAIAYLGTLKSLQFLSFISKISLAGVAYYLGIVLYYALFHGCDMSQLDARSNNIGSGFIKFVFAMHYQFSFLSIFNQMEDKSLQSISIVCIISALAITFIYTASGFLGYKAIGNEIGASHILEVLCNKKSVFMQRVLKDSFDTYGILPMIAQILFLFIWFGLICFASAASIPIIQSYLGKNGKPGSRSLVSLLLASVLFVAGIPERLNLDTILDVFAAIFTNPLSFLFPSVFMICVSHRICVKSLISYAIIAFSIAISVVILSGLFQ